MNRERIFRLWQEAYAFVQVYRSFPEREGDFLEMISSGLLEEATVSKTFKDQLLIVAHVLWGNSSSPDQIMACFGDPLDEDWSIYDLASAHMLEENRISILFTLQFEEVCSILLLPRGDAVDETIQSLAMDLYDQRRKSTGSTFKVWPDQKTVLRAFRWQPGLYALWLVKLNVLLELSLWMKDHRVYYGYRTCFQKMEMVITQLLDYRMSWRDVVSTY